MRGQHTVMRVMSGGWWEASTYWWEWWEWWEATTHTVMRVMRVISDERTVIFCTHWQRRSIALALFFVQQTAHACCSSQTRVKPNDHTMTHTFSQHAQLTYCDCVVHSFKYKVMKSITTSISMSQHTTTCAHLNKLATQIYYERSWHDRYTKRGWPIHRS